MGCDFLFFIFLNTFIIYIYIFSPLREERTLCSAERENKRVWMVETALAPHAAFAVDCMETRGGGKNTKNSVTVGTLFSFLCTPTTHTHARPHLLPRYWLLLGVRGYVFGPIEEKGNITSPVSIKSERQIGLHYCLGE